MQFQRFKTSGQLRFSLLGSSSPAHQQINEQDDQNEPAETTAHVRPAVIISSTTTKQKQE
jgi:hypothetical protein